MAPFFFFFSVLLILLFFLLIIRLRIGRNKPRIQTHNLPLPPGKFGWPIIGETLEFVKSPERFVRDRMKKHNSEVFKTCLAGEKMVVLCGPSGNKFIFSNDNKLISSWWPRSVTQVVPFANSNTKTSSLAEASIKFLKADALKNYVAVMDSTARSHMEAHWIPYKEVKVFPLAKDYTFALACRLFMGVDDLNRVRDFAEPFEAMTSGLVAVPVNFPGTTFHHAIKAGDCLRQKLMNLIKERKIELTQKRDVSSYQDLLSRLLVIEDEKGKIMNEKEIVNKIVGFLIAGFYTSSIAISFVLKHLSEVPHVYEMVLKEQMEIGKSKEEGETLKWEDVQKMKYSWNVVCEAMRMAPPAQGAFGVAISDFTYAGFFIPKGWKVHWSVHSTNKDPKYFPDPEKFDPTRFEGKGPSAYSFVPFGGGPHMCAGKEYARMEILVYLHNVVTRFRFKKANPNEKILYSPAPFPSQGLPFCLFPHVKS